MEVYINSLQEILNANSDNVNAESMSKYMRNKFDFYGIKTPERKRLCKQFYTENGRPSEEFFLDFIHNLWNMPQREYQYVAIDLLDKNKQTAPVTRISLIEELIIKKSWWDTVDGLAGNIAGAFFMRYPERTDPVTKKWVASGNIWLQRSAIIYQLKYKENTDVKLLFKYIEQLKHINEFFIQKAIGWALREYSKTNPRQVIRFTNDYDLSPLAKRESLKWINKKK